MFETFPHSKVLFISRDLIPVAASWDRRAAAIDDAWPEHNDFTAAVNEWNIANGVAHRNATQFPDRFLVVDYDRAFGKDDGQILSLLDRLGLRASESFLQKRNDLVTRHVRPPQPIAESWTRHLQEHGDFEAHRRLLEHRL